MHGDTSTAEIRQVPGETGGVGGDVDTGKIEQLKKLLADTKSLSMPKQTNGSTTWSPD